MTITTEQMEAVERSGIEPVAVEDPETGSTYDLVRADVYRKMRERVEHADPSPPENGEFHDDKSLHEYGEFRPDP